ncbi:ATPase, T2SS/T4P/T4SS family [Paenibacillus vini]|uniref:ATPase, T2SS/T4P/T4SS family n=1 Tax=Paenibacillus vini TaxID=1476024 RepID=UPI0025B71342|nr:ATPase, T2SS/T4P/T4SS family [Paenibacillus vini]MDN4067570.1 ATPase, T2SS/T4P/T4SS family [Paenibacillus vini]
MSAPLLLNAILILIVISAGVAVVLIKFKEKRSSNPVEDFDESDYTLPKILEWVKATINEITNSNLYDMGLNEEDFKRLAKKRSMLKFALKESAYGDVKQKNYVKSYIFDLLYQEYGFTEETINITIPFDDPNLLTSQDKFEILMYKLEGKYKNKALSYLIDKHGLDKLKKVIEGGMTPSYIIIDSEIDDAFRKEIKSLSFEEKLGVVVQRVYQMYKGYGVIDIIRDMKIDGVSGGVNGIPSSTVLYDDELELYMAQMGGAKVPYDYDSIWIFYKGKSIHLSFLSFGSEAELKRVSQNIYKYNMPGPLTEENGYRVNEMKDGSRVVVVRPSFAESYAFFVRKFDIPNANLDTLFPVEKVKNSELVKTLLTFLMKGRRVVAITGAPGSGKTTLMMAMVKNISATLNIRVQELAFELHLRKIFPHRNILSFRETDTVSSQQGLDLGKKTDGSVTLLGEMAEMRTASQVLQSAEVASDFTVFTGHMNHPRALVNYMSNSLVKVEGLSQNKAEEQVVNILHFNIHLRKLQNGFRYLERITEIIPLTEKKEYEDPNLENANQTEVLKAFVSMFREFAGRFTDRKTYEHRDIIRFENGRYIWMNDISSSNMEAMKEYMHAGELEAFDSFISICKSLNGGDYEEIVKDGVSPLAALESYRYTEEEFI